MAARTCFRLGAVSSTLVALRMFSASCASDLPKFTFRVVDPYARDMMRA